MSDIDPLIKREMQWMAVGVNDGRDLAPIIIRKVRRQRILRAISAVVGLALFATTSIVVYEKFFNNEAPINSTSGVTGDNTANAPIITGLLSDYPVTWEQSVGDVAAISAAGGIGDTLGGLTAVGLKISWETCGKMQCPKTWVLSVENKTADLVSTSPSLSIFNDHTPLISNSRPTTVLPGGTALLVFTFPEFGETLKVAPGVSWQWNWYLAQLR